MFTGLATIELEITDSLSLKDKRQVLQSLLERIRGRYNVAAAEVDRFNSRRYATIAVVTVAKEEAAVHRRLEKVTDLLEADPRALVTDYTIQIA